MISNLKNTNMNQLPLHLILMKSITLILCNQRKTTSSSHSNHHHFLNSTHKCNHPRLRRTIRHTHPQKAAQYPPQNLNQAAAYSRQLVQFPPPRRQANPTYQGGLNQPIPPSYVTGTQGFSTQNAYQAPQPQAVPFPPQNNNDNNNNGYNRASLLHKPAVQPPTHGIPGMTRQVDDEGWNTGLFDCMDDPTNAIITACFPCITFGQVAEIIDNGQTPCATSGLLYGLIAFFIRMPCIMSCGYRTKLRSKYGLVETPAPDWITHCFCEWCALCQEYRELRSRGLDPAIGWQGNLSSQSMQNPQVAMTPPTNQKMVP